MRLSAAKKWVLTIPNMKLDVPRKSIEVADTGFLAFGAKVEWLVTGLIADTTSIFFGVVSHW
jgi:hypothetical protein